MNIHTDNYKSFLKKIEENKSKISELRDKLGIEHSKQALQQALAILENTTDWDDLEKSKKLGKDIKAYEKIIEEFENLQKKSDDLEEFYKGMDASDAESFELLMQEYQEFDKELSAIELQSMFCSPLDKNNCFLEIHPGSGGVEAGDWAEMLMRMYIMWANKNGFQVETEDLTKGDVAGIKDVILKISGEHAYGWLRRETGIHRLVRKSPFDSGNRRHTSFASVFVSPEVDEDIVVEMNPADLLIETYRSGGAGGQHVNKTDSAVRITHMPTKLVAQCQSERSQHQNKAHAMLQLKSKIYALELKKKNAIKQKLEDTKDAISWGNQIRSYVLDASRIKDLRTGFETSDCSSVLDGDLQEFLVYNIKHIKED